MQDARRTCLFYFDRVQTQWSPSIMSPDAREPRVVDRFRVRGVPLKISDSAHRIEMWDAVPEGRSRVMDQKRTREYF
ncbi:hypothetical protein NDU88_002500 [Pleurodeles waltl]|uniref:Uncharacterized protein n=1 Tax=Pleurodeles waltl TaxID=8319 RepID=A0AAV7SAN7_PLEWA|nr:hypothetical protein NDU88_002500 [Pleurodeles waltl]